MSGYFLWQDASGNLERTDIPEQPLTIGSREPCSVVVPDAQVGPIHAAIEREQNGCRLRRLSRVKKVTVNGKPVEEHRLQHGDKVGFGGYEASFVSAVPVASRMLRLVLTRGDDEIPVELPVAGTITTVGRMEGDIVLDDPAVSSRHLEIENFGPGLRFVRDLGSTNGSELNGKPLTQTRQAFKDGDVLQIGLVQIKMQDGGKPPDGLTSVIQRTVIFISDSARA